MKFFNISLAVDEFITSPFLLTLLTTQASKAIGNKSIFFSTLISGINFLSSLREANDKYLSFSSLTKGF